MGKQSIDGATPDIKVVGLVTGLKEHRVAWVLGERLGNGFRKEEDLVLEETDESFHFSIFSGSYRHRSLRLIRNKSYVAGEQNSFILPELSNIDYLLTLEGNNADELAKEICALLQDDENIQFARQLETKKIRSRENLIF
ncbi:IPExxxVDY family protein [Fulvitalea axinellae]